MQIAVLTKIVAPDREYKKRATPGVRCGALRNEIVAILNEACTPLHRHEIYQRLMARGIRINGGKPMNTMGAHLSNDRRFRNVGYGMWGLTAWQQQSPTPSAVVPLNRQAAPEEAPAND